MELHMNRESVCVNELAYDGVAEQAVELDYLLPDYCADIFKVLKCQLTPKVVSYHVSGDKLTVDTVVLIKVLYLSEDMKAMKCIDQKLTYSKTVELNASCENPVVHIRPKTDYVNCRVVNSRRIDIRGAISCQIKVYAQIRKDVLCDVEGMGVQQRRRQIPYTSGRKLANKQFTVREELETGFAHASVGTILKATCDAVVTDCKVISGKIIAKGEARLCVLFVNADDACKTEKLEYTIPISQIVDVEGVDESFQCYVTCYVITCDVTAHQNAPDDPQMLACEIVLSIQCSANGKREFAGVLDEYSTAYETDHSSADVRTEELENILNETVSQKCAIDTGDSAIEGVIDVWATVGGIHTACENGTLVITASPVVSLLAIDTDRNIVYFEKNCELEAKIPLLDQDACYSADPDLDIQSVSYTLTGANTVEVKIDFKIGGCVYKSTVWKLLEDMRVHEDAPKTREKNYAMTLYYADTGENVWDIAKHYNTPVLAVMEANDLEDETISRRGVLLIPMA